MTAEAVETDQAEPSANLYPSVYAFVGDFLAEVYAHPLTEQDATYRWCPRWWEHTEALARLEALWRAWEVLRLDPGTGPASWFGIGDTTMQALTAPTGPFARCGPTTHKLPPALPCLPAPDLGLAVITPDSVHYRD